MPLVIVTSGGKQVPIYYELHGAWNSSGDLTRAAEPPEPPKASRGDAVARSLELPRELPFPVQRVLVVVGLGARASTNWCSHLVEHLSGLADGQGRMMACVCTYDPRGCGASYTSTSLREYSTRIFAEDALGLMDALGWDSAHIFGWSLGAQVASKVAAIAPHRVASLTLFGCSLRGWEFLLSLTLFSPRNCCGMSLGACWPRAQHWASLQRFFTQAWLNTEVEHQGRRETRYRILMRNSLDPQVPNRCMDKGQHKSGQLGQELACVFHRLKASEVQRIAGSQVPVVVVNGQLDGTSPLHFAVKLCKRLGATLVAPHATHAGILIEQAELVLWVLEGQIFGRAVSTKQQRQEVQRRAEKDILTNSFDF